MAFHGSLENRRHLAWADSLLADHAVFRVLWTNMAEVIPGRLWRSNHPTPRHLCMAVKRLGLRTIINLRGPRPCGSDALSRHTARRLGLHHLDMAFESRGAPQRDRILRFHGLYRLLDAPTLIHCKSGADRAGLAAGLAILFEGGRASDALQQLSWRFGHWSRARTGVLDAFFLRYAQDAEGRLPFLNWVEHEYDEAALKRDFIASRLSTFITDKLLRRE